jgi:hypothetical protein
MFAPVERLDAAVRFLRRSLIDNPDTCVFDKAPGENSVTAPKLAIEERADV